MYKIEVQREEENNTIIINNLNITFPVGLACVSGTSTFEVVEESLSPDPTCVSVSSSSGLADILSGFKGNVKSSTRSKGLS